MTKEAKFCRNHFCLGLDYKYNKKMHDKLYRDNRGAYTGDRGTKDRTLNYRDFQRAADDYSHHSEEERASAMRFFRRPQI